MFSARCRAERRTSSVNCRGASVRDKRRRRTNRARCTRSVRHSPRAGFSRSSKPDLSVSFEPNAVYRPRDTFGGQKPQKNAVVSLTCNNEFLNPTARPCGGLFALARAAPGRRKRIHLVDDLDLFALVAGRGVQRFHRAVLVIERKAVAQLGMAARNNNVAGLFLRHDLGLLRGGKREHAVERKRFRPCMWPCAGGERGRAADGDQGDDERKHRPAMPPRRLAGPPDFFGRRHSRRARQNADWFIPHAHRCCQTSEVKQAG